jgi:tetratricopeptide (TPR) repeat protein
MRRALPALALALACSHAQRNADGTPAFREFRGEHVRVVTDLPDAEGRAAVVEFERIRIAFYSTFFKVASPPPGGLVAVGFADDDELHEFAPPGMLGFFARTGFGEEIVAMSGANPSDSPVLRHELAHQISATLLPRQPRWLAEGLACYLETIRSGDGGRKFVLGEVDPQRLRYLQAYPVTDWQAILSMGPEYLTAPPQAGAQFESASWLLFHWLFNTRADDVYAYLRRLQLGEDPDAAFKAVFPGLDANAIGSGVARYRQRGAYYKRVNDAPVWNGAVESRSLSAAEVHAVRARLFHSSPDPAVHARAAAEVAAALAADAGEPEAIALDGTIANRAPEERLQMARTAVRLHADDVRAQMLLAEAAPPGPERRDAIARALSIAPGDAEALRLAAWDALADPREHAAALAKATQAARLGPTDPRNLDVLAVVLAANRRCAEAVRIEQRAIEVLPEGTPTEMLEFLRQRTRQLQSESVCSGAAPLTTAQQQTPPKLRACALPPPRKVTRAAEFDVEVSDDGKVAAVRRTSGESTQADAPWEKYLRSCTFEPASADGRPIPGRERFKIAPGK